MKLPVCTESVAATLASPTSKEQNSFQNSSLMQHLQVIFIWQYKCSFFIVTQFHIVSKYILITGGFKWGFWANYFIFISFANIFDFLFPHLENPESATTYVPNQMKKKSFFPGSCNLFDLLINNPEPSSSPTNCTVLSRKSHTVPCRRHTSFNIGQFHILQWWTRK